MLNNNGKYFIFTSVTIKKIYVLCPWWLSHKKIQLGTSCASLAAITHLASGGEDPVQWAESHASSGDLSWFWPTSVAQRLSLKHPKWVLQSQEGQWADLAARSRSNQVLLPSCRELKTGNGDGHQGLDSYHLEINPWAFGVGALTPRP